MPRFETSAFLRSLTSARARAGLGALAIAGTAAGITALFMWLAATPGTAQQLFVRFRTNPPITLSVGTDASFNAFTLADVNNDGKLDLIAVDNPSNNVNVLLGNGDGTFQGFTAFQAPDSPISVAVADVTSPFASNAQGHPDGNPDIIVGADDGTLKILPGDGTGQFSPAEQDFDNLDSYNADSVLGIALGDFDKNGTTDIAVLDDADAIFFLCNDNGNFTACGTDMLDTNGDTGIKIVAGDFNGDMYTDVAVLNQDSKDISVAFGNATTPGTFDEVNPNLVTRLSEMGDGTPKDFVARDLDGDGTTDLVVITDSLTSDLPSVVLLGRRRGTLDPTFFGTDPEAIVMGLGDFDANGTTDLITLDPAGPSFFSGDGAGGFAQGFAVSAPGLGRPRLMAVGDRSLGGDSLPDFVILSDDNMSVQVAINLRNATPGPTDTPGTQTPGSPTVTRSTGPTNTATIAPPTTTLTATITATPVPTADFGRCVVPLQAGGSLAGIATGPFDSDRFPDIAVTDSANGAVHIIRNNSSVQQQLRDCAHGIPQTVSFTSIPVGAQPGAIAAVDIPPYGSVDLVVAEPSGIVILRNDGQGNFGAPESPIPAGLNPMAIAADYPTGPNSRDRLDLNRDTLPDFVVADAGSENLYIFYGKADGSFDVQQYRIVGSADSVVAADFNQDGKVDLALGRGANDPLLLIQGNLDANQHAQFNLGMFGQDDPRSASPVAALAAGFFNADGFSDLVMAREVGVAGVFLFNGDALVRQANGLSTDGTPSAVGVGMFNRDGDVDIVAASKTGDSLAFGFGDGAGGFQRPDPFYLGAEPVALSVVNIDDQGMQDVVTANRDGSITVLLSSAPPPTQTATVTPTFTETGTPTMTGTVTNTATETPSASPTAAGTLTPTPTVTRTPTPTANATFKPGTLSLSSCSVGDPAGRSPADVLALLGIFALGSWWRRRSIETLLKATHAPAVVSALEGAAQSAPGPAEGG